VYLDGGIHGNLLFLVNNKTPSCVSNSTKIPLVIKSHIEINGTIYGETYFENQGFG